MTQAVSEVSLLPGHPVGLTLPQGDEQGFLPLGLGHCGYSDGWIDTTQVGAGEKPTDYRLDFLLASSSRREGTGGESIVPLP